MLDKIVKLTKSINRRVGKEVYYKHIITIPQKLLDDLKWNDKTDLEFYLKGNELRLRKKRK